MKRAPSNETPCVFQVCCKGAQQVKLIIERAFGVSQVIPMEFCGNGVWATSLHLEPGRYRYCFHAYNGRSLTYLTPGDAPLDGLKAVIQVNGPAVLAHDVSATETGSPQREAQPSAHADHVSHADCDPLTTASIDDSLTSLKMRGSVA